MSGLQGYDQRALVLPQTPVLRDRGLALARLWNV